MSSAASIECVCALVIYVSGECPPKKYLVTSLPYRYLNTHLPPGCSKLVRSSTLFPKNTKILLGNLLTI